MAGSSHGQPAKIYMEGKQARIPVIAGSNADEASVFAQSGNMKTVLAYNKYLRAQAGRFWEEEFQAYPARSDAEAPTQFLRFRTTLLRTARGRWRAL